MKVVTRITKEEILSFGGRRNKRRWGDADLVKRNHGFKVEAGRSG